MDLLAGNKRKLFFVAFGVNGCRRALVSFLNLCYFQNPSFQLERARKKGRLNLVLFGCPQILNRGVREELGRFSDRVFIINLREANAAKKMLFAPTKEQTGKGKQKEKVKSSKESKRKVRSALPSTVQSYHRHSLSAWAILEL